jgi:hypothetical protein
MRHGCSARYVIGRLVLLTAIAAVCLAVTSSRAQAFPAASDILADGQFVYGPNVGEFKTLAFLASSHSALLPYASVIEDKASYYSINPRVLLAILELRSRAVTGIVDSADLEHAVGYGDVVGFDDELEALCSALTMFFYANLHRAPQVSDSVAVTLAAGRQVQLPKGIGAGTLAVLLSLGPLSSDAEWDALSSTRAGGGFTATYRRLFPDSDPLDTSNDITADGPPPADLLKFPFACGDTWNLSGGPHDNNNCDGAHPLSALDFTPNVAACAIPPDRWVTAPSGGTVTEVSCEGCYVAVSHRDGWDSTFYHLANPQVAAGQEVRQDQRIANPSCRPSSGGTCGSCPGTASGTHVHYNLRYNGAYVDVDGTEFKGWTVHGTACYKGYLEKDGVQSNTVTSICEHIPPVTTASIVGTMGDNGWYRSDVEVTLTAVDNSGSFGVALTEYRIDGDSPETYQGPFSISEGAHRLTYRSQDNAGNWESEKQTLVNIDPTAPEGDLVLNHGASTSHTVLVYADASATDELSGVALMRLRDAGGSWTDWMRYAPRTLWRVPGVSGVDYAVEAEYKDRAGNASLPCEGVIALNIHPARPGSVGYRLGRSTWGAARSDGRSSGHRLLGTLGQPSMTGESGSARYRLLSGYWLGGTPVYAIDLPAARRQSR